MPVNVKDLLNRATSVAKVTEGNTSSSTTKMSFTVVFSKNGKRILISKKLAESLKLSDTAQIAFVVEDNLVLLGKHLSDDEDVRMVLNLKDDKDTIKGGVTGKKIAYHSDALFAIVNSFNLDYLKSSSKSFSDISVDRSDPDNPIAAITIKAV